MKRAFIIGGCCLAISGCAPSIRSIKNSEKEACVNAVLVQAETIDEGTDVFLTIRDNSGTLNAVYGTAEPFKYKTGQSVKACGVLGTYKAVKTNKEIVRRNIFILSSLAYVPTVK
ncbi:MAG: hypothetical protein HY952_01905 [Elusimicrobia bacterium]|nr:hypothetical protein [Elusimicrobiota bacterium]